MSVSTKVTLQFIPGPNEMFEPRHTLDTPSTGTSCIIPKPSPQNIKPTTAAAALRAVPTMPACKLIEEFGLLVLEAALLLAVPEEVALAVGEACEGYAEPSGLISKGSEVA